MFRSFGIFFFVFCLPCLDSEAQPLPATVQKSATLEKISATEMISIGHRGSAIPFSYLDSNYQPIGYTMDICNKIVIAVQGHLKLKRLSVRLVPTTPTTRMPLVTNGTIDLECGVTTNTLERQKNVAFSTTIFVAESRFVSRRAAPILRIEDLRGKVVVSTVGTTNIRYLNDLNQTRQFGMEILAGHDDVDSFQILSTGRAQAYAMDDALLYNFIANTARPEDYLISLDAFSVEPYGILLNKDDPEFKHLVDSVIIDLCKSGEISRIYQKWFLKPIPPRGIQLNLPMSSALKQIFLHPTDSGNPDDYLRSTKPLK